MLTATVKTTRTKILSYACIVLATVIGIILFFCTGTPKEAENAVSLHVTDNSSRYEFLASKGVETAQEPTLVEEVLLPENPNEILIDYNLMQKEQGFDLSPYYGKTVKRFIYEVKNEQETYATIYVYNNNIIAGDISNHITGEQRPIDGRTKEK